MIALFKAIPLGAFLTLAVALAIGSAGSAGGVLEVFGFMVEGQRLYWSWSMFLAATGLSWALLAMMGD